MSKVHCIVVLVLSAVFAACANEATGEAVEVGVLMVADTRPDAVSITDKCRGWQVSLPVPQGWTVTDGPWVGTYDLTGPDGLRVEYPMYSDTKALTVSGVGVMTLGDNDVARASFVGSRDQLVSLNGRTELMTQEGVSYGTFLVHGLTAENNAAAEQLIAGFTVTVVAKETPVQQ